MDRLLIMACSQRKNPAKGLLPAIERYDGPAFRVLRKYIREEGEEGLSVLILSAKYGLLGAAREIPDYDCRLSRSSAEKLRPQVLETARRTLELESPRVVGICAGKDYQVALAGFDDLVSKDVRVDCIEGGQGPRLTALRKWLLHEK